MPPSSCASSASAPRRARWLRIAPGRPRGPGACLELSRAVPLARFGAARDRGQQAGGSGGGGRAGGRGGVLLLGDLVGALGSGLPRGEHQGGFKRAEEAPRGSRWEWRVNIAWSYRGDSLERGARS
ncbi:hypothetical protein PR202_ga23844 [Eleusine coracana subsp. coracana]|uniref:Uncharacterized protein n=1 Tax=Eleusine coracana subsp. coracana TaxID=191504 RepID=A0AAV5D677_ELECO|nr:hypothetical protein PR202_ga23844 [Eleusine coracana subsp. coracana]